MKRFLDIVTFLYLLAIMAGVLWGLYLAITADTMRDFVMWFGVIGGLGALADREMEAAKKRADA